jgi:hypothetical protein
MWDLGISTVMLIRQDASADQPLDYSAKSAERRCSAKKSEKTLQKLQARAPLWNFERKSARWQIIVALGAEAVGCMS